VGTGGDKVGKYLSITNSHDCSRSMAIYITPFRWWCKNQITPSYLAALSEKRKGKNIIMTVQHSTNAKEKLNKLIKSVHIANGEFERTEETYNTLLDTPVSDKQAREVLAELFPCKDDAGKRGKTIWRKKMEDIELRYSKADNGQTPKNTAWNLYNSIQGSLQHRGKQTDAHFKSVLLGDVSKRSATVMTSILTLFQPQYLETLSQKVNAI